jgi:hypothetical protein
MWLNRLKKLDFFTLALLGSAFLHLLIIAFVKFQPPALQFFKDQMSALDVVLVNSKSHKKPNLNPPCLGKNTIRQKPLRTIVPKRLQKA